VPVIRSKVVKINENTRFLGFDDPSDSVAVICPIELAVEKFQKQVSVLAELFL
jgi:hypothetical protein